MWFGLEDHRQRLQSRTLLSLCGEQAHALCILGIDDAIAEIYKYELEIIWLKSPFQPRHQIHKHRI